MYGYAQIHSHTLTHIDIDIYAYTKTNSFVVALSGEGKKKPITLQDASRSTQDSRGRPRFHGAFTGGFSAGYFNTVGTKEGERVKHETTFCQCQ